MCRPHTPERRPVWVKPRAFTNARTERHGGAACWINASLQAFFAPLALKDVLSQRWEALALDDRHAHQQAIDDRQIHFEHETPGHRLMDLPHCLRKVRHSNSGWA